MTMVKIEDGSDINTSAEAREVTSSIIIDSAKRPKQQGRKAVAIGRSEPFDHVETERQRREKMNQCFCAIRSVVPNISKMDKASLLSYAVAYIVKLLYEVQSLESRNRELQVELGSLNVVNNSVADDKTHAALNRRRKPTAMNTDEWSQGEMEVELKVLDREAMMRVQCNRRWHPAVRLMAALQELDVEVCPKEIVLALFWKSGWCGEIIPQGDSPETRASEGNEAFPVPVKATSRTSDGGSHEGCPSTSATSKSSNAAAGCSSGYPKILK
ncbi:hypothetical protein Cni_G20395 [Canna indica]|uniref:Transcription factor n=1 Tax=Canna indica TaxID=4628 RepID=A0AAQ3QG61_9LILI|nr:hypothetical protein Cni_G20395 [Canna indica]